MSSREIASGSGPSKGSLLNSLLSDSGKHNNSVKQQKRRASNKRPNINAIRTSSPSIRSYLSLHTPLHELNESMESSSSLNDTYVEPPCELSKMTSVLEARKKSLEEKKAKISNIQDEAVKEILSGIIFDMEKCIEDSDNILNEHNALIQKYNQDTGLVYENHKSINNLTQGIGVLTDKCEEVRDRVQSLEVKQSSGYDSQYLNVILIDSKEAEDVERGVIGPKQQFNKIMGHLKMTPPNNVLDARLIQVYKQTNGNRKIVKMLKIRFNDTVTSGRVFAQIIKYNNQVTASNNGETIKYYAEIPASKNTWELKRICYELKNEGTILNVRGSDRGILVSYKSPQSQEGAQDDIRTSLVTSEREIDDLRRMLNVPDAYMSVKDKYNSEFWNLRKSERNQKRDREYDDHENGNQSKKFSSNTPRQQ